MKVEVLEDFMHDGQRFAAGETRVVDDALGAYFCEAGWAIDVDGVVATAPRDVHRVVTLDIKDVQINQSSEVE